MGKSVIIDCKYGFSKINKYLYNKNLSKKLSDELNERIELLGNEIEIRTIPLSAKNNDKTISKFIKSLKEDDVTGIIMSENVRKNEELSKILEENLEFFSGKCITDEFIEDIYYKYLAVNNKKDYEAELVLFSDNPEITYNFLNKVCRKLKNVYIVADNYEKFDWVIKKIYEEFGFYIYFTEKIGNVFLKDRIYINLAENTDFFLSDAEKNNIIILNFSGKSIMSKSVLNTFVFRIAADFKEIMKYFKYCDQECIEFFVNVIKKSRDYSALKQFICEQNVKLKKICLKNY